MTAPPGLGSQTGAFYFGLFKTSSRPNFCVAADVSRLYFSLIMEYNCRGLASAATIWRRFPLLFLCKKG